MLSTAAYMFDIALTGESSLVCISSSTEHQEEKKASATALLAQPRSGHTSHVGMLREFVRHAFNIHCPKPMIMCRVAVGYLQCANESRVSHCSVCHTLHVHAGCFSVSPDDDPWLH